MLLLVSLVFLLVVQHGSSFVLVADSSTTASDVVASLLLETENGFHNTRRRRHQSWSLQQQQRPGVDDTPDDENENIIQKQQRRTEANRNALLGMERLFEEQQYKQEERPPSRTQMIPHYGKTTRTTVAIKPSAIPNAGLGLFYSGTEPIVAGTIMTFYDADILSSNNNDGFPAAATATQGGGTAQPDEEENEYFCKSDATAGSSSPSFLGQMINDGARVENYSTESILTYYQTTAQKRNVLHVPLLSSDDGPLVILVSIATRTIQSNEELFTSYGCEYWLERLSLLPSEEEEGSSDPNKESSALETASSSTNSIITPAVQECARDLALEIWTVTKQAEKKYTSDDVQNWYCFLAAADATGRDDQQGGHINDDDL